jgi:hypothetical protein
VNFGPVKRLPPHGSKLEYRSDWGALDLFQVIQENAPDAIKAGDIKNHFGRKVAIVCSPFLPTLLSSMETLLESCSDTYKPWMNRMRALNLSRTGQAM